MSRVEIVYGHSEIELRDMQNLLILIGLVSSLGDQINEQGKIIFFLYLNELSIFT